jgi:hypothetical protein
MSKIDYNRTTKLGFWDVFGVIDYNPYYKKKDRFKGEIGLGR